jgi:hypothetical protein
MSVASGFGHVCPVLLSGARVGNTESGQPGGPAIGPLNELLTFAE